MGKTHLYRRPLHQQFNLELTMKTKDNNRDIPPPPGGGSWAFDESTWEWVSTDPVPVTVLDPPADLAATNNEAEKE